MKDNTKVKVTWFIEAVSEELNHDLGRQAAEDSTITERSNVRCLDRRGREIVCPHLYEVSERLKDLIFVRRRSHVFVIYRAEGDELPKDYYGVRLPTRFSRRTLIKGTSLLRRFDRRTRKMRQSVH